MILEEEEEVSNGGDGVGRATCNENWCVCVSHLDVCGWVGLGVRFALCMSFVFDLCRISESRREYVVCASIY